MRVTSRRERGQALVEYGIVLALVGGLGSVGRMAEAMLSEPSRALVAGVAAVLIAGYVLTAPRRR